MNFEELNALVPYAKHGKAKSLSMTPYNGVTLLMPGRHADESAGGDFCVCVSDSEINWTMKQFNHTDIFKDIEKKYKHDKNLAGGLISDYYQIIVNGADPNASRYKRDSVPGLHRQTFLYAIQCLAVAEHRRYAQHEAKFGGRFLPLRFVLGIAEGLWTATEAAEKQKRGRPGVEWLEKDHGTPALTQKLMNP